VVLDCEGMAAVACEAQEGPWCVVRRSLLAGLLTVACGNSPAATPVGATPADASTGGPVTLAFVAGSDSTGDIALDGKNVYLTTTSSTGCPRSWMVCAVSPITKVPLGGGAPVSLASGYGAAGLAVDATNVYWADSVRISVSGSGSTTCPPDGGTCGPPPGLGADVMRVPIDGGPATTVTTGQVGAYAVAVNGTSVYWTSQTCPQTGGCIMTASTDGGAPTVLASLPDHTLGDLALDATRAYFTSDGAVMAVPLGGGAPVMLAPGPASGLAIESGNLYFTNECPSSTPLAQCIASLVKMPAGGGPATTLASWSALPYEPGSASTPHPITVDEDRVYFTRFACDDGGCEGALLTVPTAGGPLVPLDDGETITQGPGPFPLAVDETGLYWASTRCPGQQSGGVCVMKLPKK
jgi:hypothetical protein